MQVRDGRAKLCLACGKAKQKCIGAVWEQGEGVSGEPSGSAVGELGGMVAMMREMVEGQRELVEEIRNLAELVEGIFWGRDAEDYDEWLEEEWSEEELEKESKELELEKAEYQEFVKGLREKQAEEEEKQVEEEVVVENEGEKEKKIDIGMLIGNPIVIVLFLLSFSFVNKLLFGYKERTWIKVGEGLVC